MPKETKQQNLNLFSGYDVLSTENGYWAEMPEYAVNAEVIILEHEEEFVMGEDYVPSLKYHVGIIEAILSDNFSNIVYQVMEYESGLSRLFFEDELQVIDGDYYYSNEIDIEIIPKNKETLTIYIGENEMYRLEANGCLKFDREANKVTFINPGEGMVKFTLDDKVADNILKRVNRDLVVIR